MQHCARSENVANLKLKFVRAVCSQKQLPYTFKEVGGDFTRHSSYGVVEVNGFSGLAITQEGSSECNYLTNLLSKEVKCHPTRVIVEIFFCCYSQDGFSSYCEYGYKLVVFNYLYLAILYYNFLFLYNCIYNNRLC